MNALTGTWRLVRLILRLDRIKLPIWIAANVGLIALTIPQLKQAYGSPAQLIAYAAASAPSAVTRLISGALTGPSIGEISIVETYLMAGLLIVLMNIFLVVRHTRQNEETNRTEVMGSLEVGRQAPLTAVLLVAVAANLVTSGLIFLVFVTNQLPVPGSLIYSLGVGLTGLFFAGVAAITAQLYEGARTASAVGGLIFGMSFLVRGLGDAFGAVLPNGLGVKTNVISWLSPLGWTPNMRPFAGELWAALPLFLVTIPLLIGAAYILLDRRDVGSAIFAGRAGNLHATPSLLRPLGLIWRLNKVMFLGWLASFAAFGATIGAVANEFKDLIAGNEEMQKILAAIGGDSDPTNIMFSATFALAGIAIAGYGLQVLTRMRSEETTGRLELLLSTAKSRGNWLAQNLVFAAMTASLILLATGAVAGLAYGITTGDIFGQIARLSAAILVHIPAAAILLGLSLIIFGSLLRSFVALTWVLFAGCLFLFQLGALLDLPQSVVNLSPFTHTPAAPAHSIALEPLVIQSIVAVGCIAISFMLFRRRDLSTE